MTRFLTPLLVLLLAGTAAAQTCEVPTHIAWPDSPFEQPIWELDFVNAPNSQGVDGSGVEVRDVYYRGQLVMKTGHVPILNVKYGPGACNCFRDWQYSEVEFLADNPVTSCHAESTPGTVQTVCDVGGSGGDIGSFEGVSVERLADELVLTTQMSAGWYRYTMRWRFHRDGTIRPEFGFATLNSPCTGNPRRHHAYWRFDFDIDGAENDYVVETNAGGNQLVLQSESARTWGAPEDEVAWEIVDLSSGLGYRVMPGEADYDTPVDPLSSPACNPNSDACQSGFAKEDAVIARYAPGEIDDGGFGCSANFFCDPGDTDYSTSTETCDSPRIVDGDGVYDTDLVFWYRSGANKEDLNIDECKLVGPILTPIGEWGQTTAAEDSASPTGFTLDNAFPNPFSPQTTLRFSVAESQPVTLTLYDGLGRVVRTLYEGTPPAGALQTVTVDASDLPAGAYTVRLEGESVSGSTRIVLLR